MTTDVISGVAVTLRAGRKFAYVQEILQLADSVVDLGAPVELLARASRIIQLWDQGK